MNNSTATIQLPRLSLDLDKKNLLLDNIDSDDCSLENSSSSSSLSPPLEEFICPLTMEMMEVPVLTIWGHNFEKRALLEWMERSNSCPLTRNPITNFQEDVVVNRPLQAKIQYWKHQHCSTPLYYNPHSSIEEEEFLAKIQMESNELDALRRKMIQLRSSRDIQ